MRICSLKGGTNYRILRRTKSFTKIASTTPWALYRRSLPLLNWNHRDPLPQEVPELILRYRPRFDKALRTYQPSTLMEVARMVKDHLATIDRCAGTIGSLPGSDAELYVVHDEKHRFLQEWLCPHLQAFHEHRHLLGIDVAHDFIQPWRKQTIGTTDACKDTAVDSPVPVRGRPIAGTASIRKKYGKGAPRGRCQYRLGGARGRREAGDGRYR